MWRWSSRAPPLSPSIRQHSGVVCVVSLCGTQDSSAVLEYLVLLQLSFEGD